MLQSRTCQWLSHRARSQSATWPMTGGTLAGVAPGERAGVGVWEWRDTSVPHPPHHIARTHRYIYIPYTSVCISYTLQLSPNRKAVGQQWISLGNHCCREPPYWSQSVLQHHDEGMFTNTTEVVERSQDCILLRVRRGEGAVASHRRRSSFSL